MDEELPHLILTEDGTHSLFHRGLNETYHSRHGALRESQHVFIENGLSELKGQDQISLLEVGFGTGLNAFLALNYSELINQRIDYTTLETMPIAASIYQQLNYAEPNFRLKFLKLHEAIWEREVQIESSFHLLKMKIALQDFEPDGKFDLIFYDAFGPPSQPEMWTKEILGRVVSWMTNGALFVTYCAKGQVRRDLEACGLRMERLPGPPGKREMLRGTKI